MSTVNILCNFKNKRINVNITLHTEALGLEFMIIKDNERFKT
jgi:hypothetical protein